VKVFDDDVTVDPDTVRSVRGLADHPNVVGLIDVGTTDDGAPFVVMELVTAGSIGDRLRAFGPVSPTEAARIGAEVADALEAAHEAGILHRDIKPDNVLVGRRARAMLTDFGIATLDDGTLTATGTLTGTLAYTAPEVIKGQRPSAASDVFALGATLYALAAGRAAFATGEDHVAAVMWRVTTEDAPPLPPEVPFALADLIAACMAKEPDERPGLAEVATTLEAIAASTAPPPPSAAVPDELDEATEPDPADEATVVATPPPTPAATVVAPAVDDGDDAATRVVAPPAPGPPPRVRRSPSGRRTRRLVVGAVLVALVLVPAALVVLLVVGGGDDEGGEPRTVSVGSAPVAVAVGPDGGAWVANRDDATVTHVDVDGDEIATIEVGGSPSALVATDDAVWVSNADDATLDRLHPDEDRIVTTVSAGDAPGPLAATPGSVWVVNQGDVDIARIDTAIDEYAADVDLDVAGPAEVAATDDTVWVAIAGDDGTNKVLRIGAESVEVEAAIDLDAAPSGIAVTDGAVWVALGETGTVAHIAAESGAISATDDLDTAEVDDVVADGDEVWVADVAEDRVIQIDTDADEAGSAVDTEGQPDAIAVADGTLWVTTTDEGALHRIPL
ncbi:MAG TPA: protein kinase, partial [Iamia sp.]